MQSMFNLLYNPMTASLAARDKRTFIRHRFEFEFLFIQFIQMLNYVMHFDWLLLLLLLHCSICLLIWNIINIPFHLLSLLWIDCFNWFVDTTSNNLFEFMDEQLFTTTTIIHHCNRLKGIDQNSIEIILFWK